MADKLFKASDFEGANKLVLLAMQTDPRNPYAIAYQERIQYAIEVRDNPEILQQLQAKEKKSGASPSRTPPRIPSAPR